MGPGPLMDASVVIASSSDGGGAGFLGLVLFVVPFVIGWFVYSTMYRRYRNQDQRYLFERTTTAQRTRLERWDQFHGAKNRQRSSKIDGRNDDKPLTRTPHSVVREAMPAREAQAERRAQAERLAQEPREAQAPREAAPPRSAGGNGPESAGGGERPPS